MDRRFFIKSIMIFLFAIIGSYVVYHLPMKADVEINRIDLNKYKGFIINVASYDEINELYLVSDVINRLKPIFDAVASNARKDKEEKRKNLEDKNK